MAERAELSESGRHLIVAILLGLFAAYAGTYLWITALRFAEDPIGDFFGLWSCARFILEHAAVVEVYDPAALHGAQVAMGMRPAAEYPFPYPPIFLLVLWPLGHVSYWPAFGLAIGGGLLLYLWATVGRRWQAQLTPIRSSARNRFTNSRFKAMKMLAAFSATSAVVWALCFHRW